MVTPADRVSHQPHTACRIGLFGLASTVVAFSPTAVLIVAHTVTPAGTAVGLLAGGTLLEHF